MIQLPDRYTAVSSLAIRALQSVTADQYDEIVQSSHYAWSRLISQYGGEYTGSTPWRTSSGTYTTTPTTSDYRRMDLDHLQHVGVTRHQLGDGDFRIGGELYGLNIDARVTVTDLSTGGSLQASASVASTTNPAWVRPSVKDSFTAGALMLVEWEVRQNATGDPAEWWAIRSGEFESTSASDIGKTP